MAKNWWFWIGHMTTYCLQQFGTQVTCLVQQTVTSLWHYAVSCYDMDILLYTNGVSNGPKTAMTHVSEVGEAYSRRQTNTTNLISCDRLKFWPFWLQIPTQDGEKCLKTYIWSFSHEWLCWPVLLRQNFQKFVAVPSKILVFWGLTIGLFTVAIFGPFLAHFQFHF